MVIAIIRVPMNLNISYDLDFFLRFAYLAKIDIYGEHSAHLARIDSSVSVRPLTRIGK